MLRAGARLMNREKTSLNCVAVDLGAGSGRLIAGQVSGGRLELAEAGRFQTPSFYDAASGYQCWNIDEIEAKVREALASCTAAGPVASVGVDSWGVDYLLLDEKLDRVGVAVCYRDKRTEGIVERLQARLGAEAIYRRTGIQFQPYNTLIQMAACCEQEPRWMDDARHLLMIPDYLHFRLSGVISNEYTNATTTQMLGLDGRWDEVLFEAAGLKRDLMQPPTQAATVLGQMRIGGVALKVIAPATHDTASAVAGAPLESIDEAYISSGTWSLMGIESMTPMATAEAMRMNFTNEGGFERRYRVLKNLTGMWPVQRICQEKGIDDVEGLVAEATTASAWRSIVNLNDPLFLNPPSMIEAIRSYCRYARQPEPESIAQMARCVFDSLALSYKTVREELELLRQCKLARIRIVGGGCRNRLLNQLCADACQLAVTAGPVEASALGNLSAQMIALGAIENLDAARALIRASFPMEEYQPKARVPENVYQQFKLLACAGYTQGEEKA